MNKAVHSSLYYWTVFAEHPSYNVGGVTIRPVISYPIVFEHSITAKHNTNELLFDLWI